MIPQEYFEKVKFHFQGNNDKAWEWFTTYHPDFGILSPLDAIKLGKEDLVIKFINKHMR